MSEKKIDKYSYELGVIDCFCEMVAAGLKTMALSHPCQSREERDSYTDDVQDICNRYGVRYYSEDDPFLTDLFPEEMCRDTFYFIFYLDDHTLDRYLELKREKTALLEKGEYDVAHRREIAFAYGKMLSYSDEGIERLLGKTAHVKES